MLIVCIGLYTDESPGLKVDPVVVLVLSLVFIFSVVALHSMFTYPSLIRIMLGSGVLMKFCSHCQDHSQVLKLSLSQRR